MTLVDQVLLTAATALSPRSCRAERREQWAADLRDAAELGLSRWSVAAGALSTSLISRGRHSSAELELIREEEDMFTAKRVRVRAITQLAGGALGAAVLTTVLAAGGLTWASNQVETVKRAIEIPSNSGPVVVAGINDGAPPELVDWSTVHVVEITDPATGKVVWQEPK